ncbi:ABC transporter permease subunit [Bacillus sp. 165]|uniref:ABC transporter permease subunit n=1 Tax=Bacillus sp. 165 TaxID=1529117 RepID=UPI001ADBDCB2|nr:ABC transporter permease subunit [Bacillus sp. 165]MBO9129189.1 ABC transporter permease subunit [Bacillus sp. 165]
MVFNIASTAEHKSVILPAVCLSIPVIPMLVKILLFRFEGEMEKDYVTYAKAKGMQPLYILNVHVLRNVMFSIMQFMKTSIWFMLSNLFINEILFNIPGIFNFIKQYTTVQTPELFAIALFLIYFPIFLIFELYDAVIPKVMKGKE